jgi:hypothetical protein
MVSSSHYLFRLALLLSVVAAVLALTILPAIGQFKEGRTTNLAGLIK